MSETLAGHDRADPPSDRPCGGIQAPVRIRAFSPADYDAALALWSRVEGIGLNESDTRPAVAAFLTRNPGCSAVAETADGRVIGAVLCGHTGRAGFLHHLAVDPAFRRRGIGRGLVGHCFAALERAAVPRCNIFVYRDNTEGDRFWLNDGWLDPSTWKVMQKRVS